MKVLIVEDEKKTGEYLTKGLTEAGFVVDFGLKVWNWVLMITWLNRLPSPNCWHGSERCCVEARR